MKKIILIIIAMLLSIEVQALEKYTEYEFIGYEDAIKESDQFTKYEPVTLHRFYSVKKSEEEYVRESEVTKEYTCDRTNVKVEKMSSKTPSLTQINERKLALLGHKGDSINKLTISEIDLRHLAIDIIEVSSKDEVWTFPQYMPNETIEVNFRTTPIKDLKISIIYTTDEVMNPLISYFDSSTKKGSAYIMLNDDRNQLGIDILEPDQHSEIAKDLGFTSEKNLYYYTYDEKSYMCFKEERTYYEDLEVDYLEGYRYDEEEDITKYKVYKRSLIEEEIPIAESQEQIAKPILDPVYGLSNRNSHRLKDSTLAYEVNENSELTKEDESLVTEPIESKKEDVNPTLEELKKNIFDIYENMKRIKYLVLILIVLSILHTLHHLYVNFRSLN